MEINKVYLSLGSNRGDRLENLDNAQKLLIKKAGQLLCASSTYETLPWGMIDETNFFNRVISLETTLAPIQLLDVIIQIETEMGRVRTHTKYEARIIDIDVLFYNDEIMNEPLLIVPHPLMHERRFVLEPTAEIAPEYIHPVFGKNIVKLLEECTDKIKVKNRF